MSVLFTYCCPGCEAACDVGELQIGIIAPLARCGGCIFAEKKNFTMKRPDTLKGLRVSRAAVAKIMWHAISAGADGATLRAICAYISDPSSRMPRGVDAQIYGEAVAEADRAARRSAAAREAAARRRGEGESTADRQAPPPPPAHEAVGAVAQAPRRPRKKMRPRVATASPTMATTPGERRYLERLNNTGGERVRKKVRRL